MTGSNLHTWIAASEDSYPVSLWVLGLVLITIISYRSYATYIRLGDFPGPTFAGFTRLWMVSALYSEQCATWYLDINTRYGESFIPTVHASFLLLTREGSLARIGPNNLLTSDPDIFRQILNVHSGYKRGRWFDCLRINPFRANLITETDEKIHNRLRKQMAAGVSTSVFA